MTARQDIWPIAHDVILALGDRYSPAMEKAAQETELDKSEYGLLITALTFDPQPIASWRLRVRNPYTAAGRYEARLRKASRLGFFKAAHEGEYVLTEMGRNTARRMLDAACEAMAKLKPMPKAELERIAELMRRLVEACLAADEPPGKWSLTLSRKLDPGDAAAALVRIEQYISDLAAYRDDAHLAAWQPNGLSGAAWEALTLLWRGEARTLDDLCRKLERRGQSRDNYAEAANDLVQRSLVAEDTGVFAVTKQGQKTRQNAEALTDRYFYAPWKRLKPAEADELRALLAKLRDGLKRSRAK